MSGIAGYLGAQQEKDVLQAMVRKIAHRGPDAEGFHVEPPVFMGVRRLATIDPRENWLPLYSEDRKLAIAFSGELFDFEATRKKLEERGAKFKTRTDAEVALRLYEAYGANAPVHMRGHFAFAVHDVEKNLVFLARDRLGVEPLYYTTTQSGAFIFASEIKALLEHPSVSVSPDMTMVDAYLALGYCPGPGTMFRGIHALLPGHRIIWNPGLHVMVEPYWRWEDYAKPDPAMKGEADYQERFDALFEESVALYQRGEVPVGAFATGSLESAAILSAMAKNSSDPVHVFSASFGAEHDGVLPVADIAAKLGGVHQAADFQPEYMDSLPELIGSLDAPVADPHIAVFHQLTRAASQKVKIAISGAGANNVFLGYPQHDALLSGHSVPKIFWAMIKELKPVMPLGLIARLLGFPGILGDRSRRRLIDFADTMRTGSLHQQYTCMASLFDSRDRQSLYLAQLSQVIGTIVDQQKEHKEWPSLSGALLAMQNEHLLPDGVLAPLNKLSGLNSLGVRLPLLDHKLFEFMLSVPGRLRRKRGQRKILLANYVEKNLPGITGQPARFERFYGQKPLLGACMGTGPFKDMMDACLSDDSIRRRELFAPEAVKRLVMAAKTGESIPQRQVFSIVALEIWFRIFVDHEKGWLSS